MFLISGFAGPLHAAPGPAVSWFYDPWRTNNGLPSNDVTGVAQGADGALMISTLSGLARFDGLRFRPIRVDVPGRGSRSVMGLCASQDRFYMVTSGHLVEWRGGQVTASAPIVPLPQDARLMSLFVASDGTVWLSFDKGQMFHFKGGRVQIAKVQAPLPANFSSTVKEDAKGGIWAAGPGVLAKWDGTQFVKKAVLRPMNIVALAVSRDGGLWLGIGLNLLRYSEEDGLREVGKLTGMPPRARIATMLEDSRGLVWCGAYGGGLHCWDGGALERVSVAHHDVWSLSEDAEKNLWVGTGGGGLIRVRPRLLKLLDEKGGPVAQTPRSLTLDAAGDLWVVTHTGESYVRREGGWEALDLKKDLLTNEATCVAADPAGKVWIACVENKLACWDGSAFSHIPLPEKEGASRVLAMMVARDGSVWVGRRGELLHLVGEEWKSYSLGPRTSACVTLAQDRAGLIWAGTNAGKLFRVDEAKLMDETPPTLRGGLRSLLAAPDGALWVANGDGLWRVREGQHVRVARADEFEAGAISQLTLDDQMRVWIGVDQGVLVASLEELERKANGGTGKLRCSQYNASGFQCSSGYSPNTALMGSDWLWFCTRSGVIIANVKEAGSNYVAPKVSIESLRVNGKEHPVASGLKLGPRPGEIDFQFGAMSYRFPENVQILHRIAGVDAGWVVTGKDRSAHYPRLPAGLHTLEVRAFNEDGVVSERPATVAFEVVPQFWETTFFRMSAVFISIIVAAFAGRWFMVRSLRREAEALREQVAVHGERVRIARDMHDQLGASLTQISLISELMVADGMVDRRMEQLTRTARQASIALDEIVWAVNPRHDHLGSVLEYLGQQACNLVEPTGLRCRLDLPEVDFERHLPAEFRHQLFLIVREALNNVIKHAGAKEVSLSAQVSDAGLRFLVVDDGRGGALKGGGEGLHNMRARAEALGGDCKIHSHAGAGTTVEIEVPWPRLSRNP